MKELPVPDPQREELDRRLADSTEQATLSIGKVSPPLTKITRPHVHAARGATLNMRLAGMTPNAPASGSVPERIVARARLAHHDA
jgi:hypothetical protein